MWKLKHAKSIVESLKYFCQISAKLILIIFSYTVSKLVHFFETRVYVNATVEHYMAMFSFTKVESWRNVNFVPKCTRLHQIASQISKFSQGWYPRTPIPGEGTPPPRPLPRSALHASTRGLRPLDGPLTVSCSPWNERLDKPWDWLTIDLVEQWIIAEPSSVTDSHSAVKWFPRFRRTNYGDFCHMHSCLQHRTKHKAICNYAYAQCPGRTDYYRPYIGFIWKSRKQLTSKKTDYTMPDLNTVHSK